MTGNVLVDGKGWKGEDEGGGGGQRTSSSPDVISNGPAIGNGAGRWPTWGRPVPASQVHAFASPDDALSTT